MRLPVRWEALFAATLIATQAWAHGGGGGEDDKCKFEVGPYHMHFTGYQPDAVDGGREFCAHIPRTGRTVIVLDYIDDGLRDLPTEVRIVRDTGRDADLERNTVLHLPPKVYPTGSVSMEHRFDTPGVYASLVTVGGGKPHVSRFRFSVGKPDYTTYYLIAGTVAAGIALYLYTERKRRPTPRPAS